MTLHFFSFIFINYHEQYKIIGNSIHCVLLLHNNIKAKEKYNSLIAVFNFNHLKLLFNVTNTYFFIKYT